MRPRSVLAAVLLSWTACTPAPPPARAGMIRHENCGWHDGEERELESQIEALLASR